MLNIYELEKRWLKYKIKSFLPTIITFIIILIVGLTLYISIDFKKINILDSSILEKFTHNNEQTIQENIQEVSIEKTNVIQKEKKTDNTTVTEKAPETTLPKRALNSNEKNILEPSLAFMKKMQNEPAPDYKEPSKKPVKQTVQKKNTPEVTQKAEKTTPNVEKPQQKVVQETNTIKIKKQNTYEDIAYVIKRFKKNNNPALSLFVAKKYYELGEYKQAYNYALITNEINNNIEASWIVFSKSLVKLNQRAKAIQTLKQYINYSNSNQARLLLEEIVSGKFK